MSIPLVQDNNKDAINTSIIAIKRNIERINMLLGLSNSEEIDTSEFVKKSDIVDEVTVGNMQSVTSNAVYKAFSEWEQIWYHNSSNWIQGIQTPMGNFLRIRFSGLTSGYIANGTTIVTITDNRYKPTVNPNRFIIGVDLPTTRISANIDYESNGNMKIYFLAGTPTGGGQTVNGLYCDLLLALR